LKTEQTCDFNLA